MRALMILPVVTLMVLSAKADFNSDCKMAYREGAVQIMSHIEALKQGQESAESFAMQVGVIDAAVKGHRGLCHFSEDAANKTCVAKYKEQYDELKSRVNVISMLIGNQKSVDFSLLDNAKAELKLKVADLTCRSSQ